MSLFMYLFTYLVYYFVDLNIYFCFQCHGKYLLRHFARLCGIRKLIGSYLLSAQNSLTTVPSCFQHIHDCLNTVLSDHRVLFLFVGHTPFARIFSASPFELCRDISRPTRGAKNLIEQTRGGGGGDTLQIHRTCYCLHTLAKKQQGENNYECLQQIQLFSRLAPRPHPPISPHPLFLFFLSFFCGCCCCCRKPIYSKVCIFPQTKQRRINKPRFNGY